MTMAATGVAPPHSIEAEQSVLGGVILSNTAIRGLAVEERLCPEHFFRDGHRLIWQAILDLDGEGHQADVLTITDRLAATGHLEEVGGRAAIDGLTGGVPGLGGIRRYAQIVIGHWRDRQRMASAYDQLAALQWHDEDGYQAALTRAHQLVATPAAGSLLEGDAFASYLSDWLEGDADEGVPVPAELSSLRRFVRFRRANVTVIGGWSGMGKSFVASQFAEAAGIAGLKAVVWSNEDTPEMWFARWANRVTGVPERVISDRKMTAEQLEKVTKAAARVPFKVEDCAGVSAQEIARHIVQVRPDVAVVDHFHMLPRTGETKDADDAMRALVAAAAMSGCHLFLVVQLNLARNVGIVRPPPVGRDVRGTGSIYFLCHNMLMVHRNEDEVQDMSGRSTGRSMQLEDGVIDVVKQKSGRLGSVAVLFNEHRLLFTEEARGVDAADAAPVAGSREDFGW